MDTARTVIEILALVGGLIGIWVRMEVAAAKHDVRLAHLEKGVDDIWKHINPSHGDD